MKTWIASALLALAPAGLAWDSPCPDETVKNCPGMTQSSPNYDTCVEYVTILVIEIPISKTHCHTSYVVIPPHRHCDSKPRSGMRCVPGETLHAQLFKCRCVPSGSGSSESCQCDSPTSSGTVQDFALAECAGTPEP